MYIYSLIAKGIVGVGVLGLTSEYIKHKMEKGEISVQSPVDNVSIIVPSYNEESFIEQCLSSLRNQSVVHEYPNMFEYILSDSNSKDNTVKLAEPYVDKIIHAPRGKLTARNLAIDNSNNNIIVSTDADTIYPYTWLNTLLKPFNEPKTAAVVGSTFESSIPYIPLNVAILASTLERTITRPNQMIGRNSAFYKHLFYKTGKFNENVNQQNLWEMLEEEEYNLGERLSKHGNIVFQIGASCNHLGGQKIGCRLGISDRKLCNNYKIGIERFG